MLRSFRAQDFIQLPPLGEAGTLTLVDELEAIARATPKVPSSVLGVLARLLEACADLQKHISVRERAGSAVRRSLDATHLAVREYVAHVAAMVRRTDSETVTMAAVLLEPLSLRAGGADAYESLDDDTIVSVTF